MKIAIEKFWQGVRFFVVAGVIFVVMFLLMNFSAYKKIVLNHLDPEAQQMVEVALERASGQQSPVVQPEDLLPVLNPEKKVTHQKYTWPENTPLVSSQNLIFIPKTTTVAPIVEMENGLEYMQLAEWNNLESGIQKALENGVLHYPSTAKPDELGNFFITGHSSYYAWKPGEYKDVFALLSELEPGDQFSVHYNQKPYHYIVQETKIVEPSDVSVLEQPSNEKIATILTCYPTGSTRYRFAAIAKQIEVPATS